MFPEDRGLSLGYNKPLDELPEFINHVNKTIEGIETKLQQIQSIMN